MEAKSVSPQTIRRLPVYMRFLAARREATVSATAIAEAFGLSDVQVRKDLAAVSSGGRSGVGYDTKALAGEIERFLGIDRTRLAVLAGAGNLGQALIHYRGFSECGMRIAAAFDPDPLLAGTRLGDIPVYPPRDIQRVMGEIGAEIGIIAVPESAAPGVCGQMVAGGARAIWNFAPAHLSVPQSVLLQNENLAASLVMLSKHLARQM